MSGVQATLALVLLRNLRRGGKCLRLWFAKRVFFMVRQHVLCNARTIHQHFYDTLRAREFWERVELAWEIERDVEKTSRHQVYATALRRVRWFSRVRNCERIAWRRVRVVYGSIFSYCGAPPQKRRSARLSIKRNAKRRKNDE